VETRRAAHPGTEVVVHVGSAFVLQRPFCEVIADANVILAARVGTATQHFSEEDPDGSPPGSTGPFNDITVVELTVEQVLKDDGVGDVGGTISLLTPGKDWNNGSFFNDIPFLPDEFVIVFLQGNSAGWKINGDQYSNAHFYPFEKFKFNDDDYLVQADIIGIEKLPVEEINTLSGFEAYVAQALDNEAVCSSGPEAVPPTIDEDVTALPDIP